MKKALGRGLDALISGGVAVAIPATIPSPSAHVDHSEHAILDIDIERIEQNRMQPRQSFNEEELRELERSIAQRGVVQPLLVRRNGNERFELIAGERRWRAARAVGLKRVPAIVRQVSDQEALELALIENLQREDLNPIEEARAYAQLSTQFHLTQEQIAEKVGKNRATVANSMRLLDLPAEVLSWIALGRLSVGHAKAILGLSIADEQRLVAERVLKKNLTVRETEKLVERLKGPKSSGSRKRDAERSAHIAMLEDRLQQKFQTHVAIVTGRKKGRIEIQFYGNDDLDRLLGILGIEPL
jgi:ParB family chromosome partitioning protein